MTNSKLQGSLDIYLITRITYSSIHFTDIDSSYLSVCDEQLREAIKVK